MSSAVAALLNFLVWGAGYLYTGTRMVPGILLLAGYLPIHWYWFMSVGVPTVLSGADTLAVLVGHLLLSTGLAYDVYTRP